jgi:vitamin B12 transporter
MKKRIIYSVVAALMLLPLTSKADEKKENKMKTMEEVVVTATRTTSTLEKIGGSSVTIITAEDIEAKQQASLKEILRGAPGIDMVSDGSPGSRTAVFLRGADSDETLVLIDGIMLNDSADPNRRADLANITVDNIERIEIVRGPLSALYGSNATAGVINIITKKGSGKPSIHAGVEGGSYEAWKAYVGASGSLNKFNYSLSAARTETEGFSSANADNNRIPHGNNTSEKDGWANTNFSGRLGVSLTPSSDLNAVFRYMKSEIDLDAWAWWPLGYALDGQSVNGIKDQNTENEQLLGKISLKSLLFDDFFESNIYVQGAKQERKTLDDFGNSFWSGKNWELGWEGGLYFLSDNLSFGASYFEEKTTINSFSDIDDKKADTKSLWIQNQLFIGESLDLVAGVRVDKHKRFGSKIIYRIAPAYTLSKTNTVLKANYGTGFRAPSLYELFIPVYGNPGLEPEESVGWDVSFEQTFDDHKITFGATYFDSRYKNRIGNDPFTFVYSQLPGNTDISGVEISTDWQATDDLAISLNYSYLSTEDPAGERLVRRPDNKYSLNFRYRLLEKGLINADVIWVDERDPIVSATDKDGNSVTTLDSYTRVNISARYALNDRFQIYGRIDNLFDEEYEEAWSYATPSLSGYIGLKFTL